MDDLKLKLQPGDALQLQFLDDPSRARSYVKVIGYLEPHSLLVTAPRRDGKILLLREGQGFVVRLLSGSRIFGFNASVLRVCARPFPYVHLSYPSELAQLVVRKAQRVRIETIVSIENEEPEFGDNEPRSGVMRDVSTSGALVACDRPAGRIGDVVTVAARLRTAGIDEYITLPAVIRNVRNAADDDGSGKNVLHGVEFQLVEPRDTLLLHSYVHEQLVKELTAN